MANAYATRWMHHEPLPALHNLALKIGSRAQLHVTAATALQPSCHSQLPQIPIGTLKELRTKLGADSKDPVMMFAMCEVL